MYISDIKKKGYSLHIKKQIALFLIYILGLLFTSSSTCLAVPAYPENANSAINASSPNDKASQAPDYKDPENWMFFAGKPHKFNVDIFWVYPTVYGSKKNWNTSIDDKETRDKAYEATLKFIGVFQDSADIYAPYYRQASGMVLTASEEQNHKALGVAIDDVCDAFNYYILNVNKGRPFIIAGHSQGSNILIELMKKLFADQGLQKQLIAAYLIGWSVTENDLKSYPFLKIADSDSKTGSIITYNTIADGFQDKSPTILPGTVVVNPLTWTTSDNLGPASLNLGAVFFGNNIEKEIIPHFTSAQIKNGGLVIPRQDNEDELNLPFGPGIYHNYDYLFFYENIKANVKERISTFFNTKK